MDKSILAKIWCDLNRFDYPKEFGDEPDWWMKDGDRTRYFIDGAMKSTRLLVTPKQIAREWNSDWSEDKFLSEWADEDFRRAWES